MKVLMELTEEEGGFIRQKKNMFAKAHWPPQLSLERIFHARPGTDSARPNGRDNFHSLRSPKIAVPDLMLTNNNRSLSTAGVTSSQFRG